MVEIDVRAAGGQIIVIHDDTLERTTTGSGSVYALPFSDLRRLDAGKGEKIPTLAEVLNITLPALPLNIELKDTEAVADVCRLLEQQEQLDTSRILISSFHEEATVETRRRLPQIPIGILAAASTGSAEQMFGLAAELGACSVHPHVDTVTGELVREAHASKLHVLPYTARTSDQLQHLLSCGADGCFADDPKWAGEERGGI